MRRLLERWVRGWWRGELGPAGALLAAATIPLEVAYRAVVALRDLAYRRGWMRRHRVEVPVVSVGNLTVGGTGKTPVAAWLAAELAAEGHRPAVVCRGYGVDELRLHRRWNPGVPVHAHADRVRAARLAVAEGARILILDDGFQHRRLARDVDLVLVAAEDPFPGRMLPRGPYREPAEALDRADVVVVTRRTASDERAEEVADRLRAQRSGRPVARVRFVAGGWSELGGAPAEAPRGDVMAVASVARPESFAGLVEELTGTRPPLLAFPDHHLFHRREVERIRRTAGRCTLVVTEKDAVKLEEFAEALPPTRVLRLRLEPEAGAGETLERIHEVVRRGAEA